VLPSFDSLADKKNSIEWRQKEKTKICWIIKCENKTKLLSFHRPICWFCFGGGGSYKHFHLKYNFDVFAV
jgi:hypothetical protein